MKSKFENNTTHYTPGGTFFLENFTMSVGPPLKKILARRLQTLWWRLHSAMT